MKFHGSIVVIYVVFIIFRYSSLGLEYLDLYLIHWPLRFTIRVLKRPKPEEIQPLDIHSTWRAMEECVELGLTKAIGVSNFSSKKIRDLLKTAKIVPAVNQVIYWRHVSIANAKHFFWYKSSFRVSFW